MPCQDEISQYVGKTMGAERIFSITQHWANGAIGHAHGVVNQKLPPNGADIYFGPANFSYDPYGRNPIHFSLNGTDGYMFISYLGLASSIVTEFTDLFCVELGSHLLLKGTEKEDVGPGSGTGAALPEYTFVNLWSVAPLWEHELSKRLFDVIKGAHA